MVLAWVRVLQEAGVRICSTGRARNRDVERYIRDTHLRRDRFDNRRMDITAPATAGVFGGAPLFIDATVLSPLTGTGEARSRTDHTDGAVMEAAARTNRAVDYPDVELSPHAQLLHLGVETFGRWGKHSLTLVPALARSRADSAPPILKSSLQHAFTSRWFAILSVALQKSIADSVLLSSGTDLAAEAQDRLGAMPLIDVLDFNR